MCLGRSRSLGELPPSTCGAGSALTPSTPLPLLFLLLLLLLPIAPAGAGGGRSPGSESTPGFALQCTHYSTSTCTNPRHCRPTLVLQFFFNTQALMKRAKTYLLIRAFLVFIKIKPAINACNVAGQADIQSFKTKSSPPS